MHNNHTPSDGEGLLKFIWFIRRIRMHPLFGLQLYFLTFIMSPYLIRIDIFIHKIFSFINWLWRNFKTAPFRYGLWWLDSILEIQPIQFSILKSLNRNGIEKWKWITRHRNFEPTISPIAWSTWNDYWVTLASFKTASILNVWTSLRPASKFRTLMSLINVSPYRLLILRWMSATLHLSVRRN